ncbi:GntR family transcriptional regulator/MocR family aminotransferase [Actinoalloteichus hoggarensis]|uniref:HTH-type transcriptional regulatory protein GabR n=1 Tax=Actinoalloteichus hoggarensis TaxID=1470176 RepID=A0A221VY20_9PSEU|nr:PLP-dependent aminotransferase family protein [Actinoalloteichus hoggarensis]ASO18436.1 HTH-type transcriptional regulatory protein GabR [Actinoalloteichus hoggarensis]MBB5921803.1 GntR family transcriptional regulator/MocR family aminotransferase [Actinoalloteichus hoggarensis]
MPADWTTLRELLLPEMSEATRGRRERTLTEALRNGIRVGRLAARTRLPSSRDLAAQLRLARGTVTSAYAQLVAEGYLIAVRGSGTSVAEIVDRRAEPRAAVDPQAPPGAWDLRPGLPALAAFPRTAWVSAVRAGLAELPDADLGYPDPVGLHALRAELAAYLGRVRSVHADPAEVIVTRGAAEGFSLMGACLAGRGHREIAVENPGHPGQPRLFAEVGLSAVPIPVDEDGLRVDLLAETTARAVLVTPAHQFPLGVALAPHRRLALVEWARRVNGLILEDDYDAEHRYDRAAIGAMRSLAPDHVAYLGSVSKTLAPALRLGWLVPPPDVRAEVARVKLLRDLGSSTIDQAALARLLRDGGYDRHLRRTRRLNRHRRDALVDALTRCLPDWRVIGVAAGLHLVAGLPDGVDDTELSEALARAGVTVPPLTDYLRDPTRAAPFAGLVLGYAGLTPDRLRAAVRVAATVYRGRATQAQAARDAGPEAATARKLPVCSSSTDTAPPMT